MVLPPVKMFDASVPPASAPAGYRAVAGYIGGDTPHVWTDAEWKRFDGLHKLPIWVRSNPADVDGEVEAFGALRRLYQLRVPREITVAIDLETAVNDSYVRKFHSVMRWAGYFVWVYGSASTVFENPVAEGYWVADYAGKGPFMSRTGLSRPPSTPAGRTMTPRWSSTGNTTGECGSRAVWAVRPAGRPGSK